MTFILTLPRKLRALRSWPFQLKLNLVGKATHLFPKQCGHNGSYGGCSPVCAANSMLFTTEIGAVLLRCAVSWEVERFGLGGGVWGALILWQVQ